MFLGACISCSIYHHWTLWAPQQNMRKTRSPFYLPKNKQKLTRTLLPVSSVPCRENLAPSHAIGLLSVAEERDTDIISKKITATLKSKTSRLKLQQ